MPGEERHQAGVQHEADGELHASTHALHMLTQTLSRLPPPVPPPLSAHTHGLNGSSSIRSNHNTPLLPPALQDMLNDIVASSAAGQLFFPLAVQSCAVRERQEVLRQQC